MIRQHTSMAHNSLRNNKIRTFLTLLGIIIGVTSVTTIISLGEGVKRQVNQQIQDMGAGLVTITPGKQKDANLLSLNTIYGTPSSAARLSEADLTSVKKTPNAEAVTGVMQLDGSITRHKKTRNTRILGVDEGYLNITKQKLSRGQFFGGDLENNQTVVLASNVADALFGLQDPIGSTVIVRGQEFVVIGVLDARKGFNFGQAVDDMVLIPMPTAKTLNQETATFQQINIKLKDANKSYETAKELRKQLLKLHGEEDFTITTEQALVNTTNNVFRALTAFTAAVASISLLVGGIGVMNIMLVTVTERTKEIGIRKAIGATRTQIMMQFLVEALVITLAGGIIGIIFSLIISYIIGAQTPIKPALDPWIVGLAAAVSMIVGVIFGTWPAVRAARKSPLESLRHD